jgi:hypothetical protein
MVPDTSATRHPSTTGLRRFLDLQQQRDWMEGKTIPRDVDERSESLELRFKYVARFEKLLRRPQAQEVLEILQRYGRGCIPIPRRTERHYWSVSCLPSTPGKALVRVNASWMELFSLYADGEGIRALFLVHLSDFTTDHSLDQGQVDEAFLERCVIIMMNMPERSSVVRLCQSSRDSFAAPLPSRSERRVDENGNGPPDLSERGSRYAILGPLHLVGDRRA